MSHSDTATIVPNAAMEPRRGSTSKGGNIALWVLQIGLAAMFAFSAIGKLTGSKEMVEYFDDLGPGAWLRYTVGILELAGAVGLLIPRLAGLAAVGLAALMLGAIVTHVIVGGSAIAAAVLLIVTALVAWNRRESMIAWYRVVAGSRSS